MPMDIRPYGPGKFSTIIDSLVWNLFQEEGFDDELADPSFGWRGLVRLSPEDGPLGVILMQENPTQLPLTAAESEFLGEACGMILTEHPNGLVSIDYYTSQEDLGSAWATLQSDYDTLINEDEMDA